MSGVKRVIVERKRGGQWHIVWKTSSLMGGSARTLCGRSLPYGCARAFRDEVKDPDLCFYCSKRETALRNLQSPSDPVGTP